MSVAGLEVQIWPVCTEFSCSSHELWASSLTPVSYYSPKDTPYKLISASKLPIMFPMIVFFFLLGGGVAVNLAFEMHIIGLTEICGEVILVTCKRISINLYHSCLLTHK